MILLILAINAPLADVLSSKEQSNRRLRKRVRSSDNDTTHDRVMTVPIVLVKSTMIVKRAIVIIIMTIAKTMAAVMITTTLKQ